MIWLQARGLLLASGFYQEQEGICLVGIKVGLLYQPGRCNRMHKEIIYLSLLTCLCVKSKSLEGYM
jgi:hypothetical protein